MVGVVRKKSGKGFTLMEALIVLALMTMAGSFILLVSMETYRGSSFRSERNTVVALLERARAQSIGNVCIGTCTDGKPHGVAIRPGDRPNQYVLFQGSDYASRDSAADAVFDSNQLVSTSGLSEVTFAQLSLVSSTIGGSTLTLSDAAGHISTITIGAEGQITWTN